MANPHPTAQALKIAWSESARDERWDDFLKATPAGEYQQSGMWAETKAAEGWRVVRMVMEEEGRIVGGFQLLWNKTRVGRIGYVSRGPVVVVEQTEVGRRAVDLLKQAARDAGLVALITQAPECDNGMDAQLAEGGFLPNRLRRIITATWITPVTSGMEAVEAGMRGSTRNTWRKSIRRGVTVHSGGREELNLFFDLMVETCRRQKTLPNPGTVESLRVMWDAFRGGLCRLTFARHEGKTVAGLLCLVFGRRVYAWKKGAISEARAYHPMEALYHDALTWACAQGFEACDFCGMKQATAEMILAGEELTDEVIKSRDFYNIGFGGKPVLLPKARVLIPNPVLRALYRITACSSHGSALLRKRYEC